jgi:hypothetical protein
MDGSITITIAWELLDCGDDLGTLLAILVDGAPISLLHLTEEEIERLCN